jgi:hypothetical protein
MLTREQADKILAYVAQELISPFAFDDRPAYEIWLELTSRQPFNKLCEMVYALVDKKESENEPKCTKESV